MIKEYDIVRLKPPLPSKNLPAGAIGTVLIVYDNPNLPRAYEVEFMDDDGNTLAVITLEHEFIEKI
jgi:hypothetical protein